MKIAKVNINFERESLVAPFGFKGGYLTSVWQSVVKLESESGKFGVGLGTQSVLWSDADVFVSNPETAGNGMMYLTSAYAAEAAKDIEWNTPIELLKQLVPVTYEYAKKVTRNPKLRLTFALNALVPVDNAAWQLYCAENNIASFDDMVPEEFKSALPVRNTELASIPLMSYGVGMDKIVEAISDGYFFLKVKVGSDPDKDGCQDKMLEWDKKRISDIHEAAKNIETPYTDSGHIPYYLDANGRYESKERLQRLLDHADKIGALERIMIMEEPFPEEYKVDVSDLPVRLAADESAHSDEDVLERIELGYKAIALKPIAKTMSMSLIMAKVAHDKNIPCFCADLTVSPVLVDWNKNVAARLAPLPGFKVGLLETNGHQNYTNWEDMRSWHPCNGAEWMNTRKGLFHLDDDFYARSGGILENGKHYLDLV